MAKFIEIDGGVVNADRLLFAEAERAINTGEPSGYARLVFDTRAEMLVPLRGRSVGALMSEFMGEREEGVNKTDTP